MLEKNYFFYFFQINYFLVFSDYFDVADIKNNF